jgi:hypothetical protein
MSELHVLFPKAAPVREQAVEVRSEEPLVPATADAAVQRVQAWHAFRLGARHAILRFRLWFAVMAFMLLAPLTGLWFLRPLMVVMALVLPVFAFLASIDGDGRSQRFWVGAGGPPAMRALGRMAVDLGALHVGFCIGGAQALRTDDLSVCTQGRLGAAFGLVFAVVGVAAMPHVALETLSEREVLVFLWLASVPLGLVGRLLLTGRWSAAGAERRWWSPAWLLAPVLAALLLAYVLLAGPGTTLLSTIVGL